MKKNRKKKNKICKKGKKTKRNKEVKWKWWEKNRSRIVIELDTKVCRRYNGNNVPNKYNSSNRHNYNWEKCISLYFQSDTNGWIFYLLCLSPLQKKWFYQIIWNYIEV